MSSRFLAVSGAGELFYPSPNLHPPPQATLVTEDLPEFSVVLSAVVLATIHFLWLRVVPGPWHTSGLQGDLHPMPFGTLCPVCLCHAKFRESPAQGKGYICNICISSSQSSSLLSLCHRAAHWGWGSVHWSGLASAHIRTLVWCCWDWEENLASQVHVGWILPSRRKASFFWWIQC